MPAPGDPTILMHAEVDETRERSYELMQSNWMALHAGVGGTCFIALVWWFRFWQTAVPASSIYIMGPIDCGGGLHQQSFLPLLLMQQGNLVQPANNIDRGATLGQSFPTTKLPPLISLPLLPYKVKGLCIIYI